MRASAKARQSIEEGAAKALGRVDKLKPFVKPSINLKIVFVDPGVAEVAELAPSSERVTAGLRYRSKDLLVVYRAFLAMITLSDTVV